MDQYSLIKASLIKAPASGNKKFKNKGHGLAGFKWVEYRDYSMTSWGSWGPEVV